MGRLLGSKDKNPRIKRTLKEPQICPKHGVFQVRRKSSASKPRGDLRCLLCARENSEQNRKKNPERCSKIQRQCYEKNPILFMLSRARVRARKHSVPFELKKEDLFIPEFCPVLGISLSLAVGKRLDNSPSLDRLIPSLGYAKGNVVVMSDKANRIKNNATVEEVEAVASYMRNIQ